MMQPLKPDHPLRRLFSGTVQHALFVDVGICDTQLADLAEAVEPQQLFDCRRHQ